MIQQKEGAYGWDEVTLRVRHKMVTKMHVTKTRVRIVTEMELWIGKNVVQVAGTVRSKK